MFKLDILFGKENQSMLPALGVLLLAWLATGHPISPALVVVGTMFSVIRAVIHFGLFRPMEVALAKGKESVGILGYKMINDSFLALSVLWLFEMLSK